MNNKLIAFAVSLALSTLCFSQDLAEKLNSTVEVAESVRCEKWNILMRGSEVFTFITDKQQPVFVMVEYDRIAKKAVYSHLKLGADKNYDQYIVASKISNLQKLRKLINDIDLNHVAEKELKAHIAYLRNLAWR
jgi:hypothetical protein